MEPLETPSNQGLGEQSFSRFHDAPQALFGLFLERTGRARTDMFSATAARMSAFNASSSIVSPSRISMARRVLPSRLELNRLLGSSSAGAPGEGQLHDSLVRLAGADDAVVLPHRNAAPLPRLDHLRVGLSDESSDPGERLAPPIAQLLDSRIYPLRGRVFSCSFRRAASSSCVVAFFMIVVARPSLEYRSSALGAIASCSVSGARLAHLVRPVSGRRASKHSRWRDPHRDI